MKKLFLAGGLILAASAAYANFELRWPDWGFPSAGDPNLKAWFRFADDKSLVGRGSSPTLTFTRASGNATYYDSTGVQQTAATDEPRFDHDPSTLTSLGILLERASTNDALQSEDLSTTWTNPGGNTTIGSFTGTAKDGNATAEDVLHGDDAETIQQTITAVNNTVYTISAFAKQGDTGSHDFVKMSWIDQSAGTNGFEAWFDLTDCSVGTAQSEGTGTYTASSALARDVGDGWCRISASGQIVSGQTDARFEIINTTADAVDTAEATNSVAWWGLHAGTGGLSSYISTTTVVVVRDTDNLVTTDTAWFNADAGTWYAKARKLSLVIDDGYIFEMGGTTADRHYFRNATTNPTYTIFDGTSLEANIDAGSIASGISFEMAGAYAVNDVAVSVDGGAVATDTSVTLPAFTDIDQLEIGAGSAVDTDWNGTVAVLKYWNVRKPSSFLQAITN